MYIPVGTASIFILNISRFSIIMLMRYLELLFPKDKSVFILQEALENQETTQRNGKENGKK